VYRRLPTVRVIGNEQQSGISGAQQRHRGSRRGDHRFSG
jgi:hypothetical protein